MSDCFFHTGRPSVIRCKQCGRPLCTECRVIETGGIFCSEKCANNYKVFAERAEEIESKRTKSSGKNSLIKFIVFLIVLVIIYLFFKRFF